MSLIISSTGLQKFVGFLVEQNNISWRGVEACANATSHNKIPFVHFSLKPQYAHTNSQDSSPNFSFKNYRYSPPLSVEK